MEKLYKPDTYTLHVTLPCYEGVVAGEDAIYSPPGRVLQVCVVSDRVFLSYCKYDEGYDTTETKTKHEVQVDADALLNALIIQMGVERVRLALPVQ